MIWIRNEISGEDMGEDVVYESTTLTDHAKRKTTLNSKQLNRQPRPDKSIEQNCNLLILFINIFFNLF